MHLQKRMQALLERRKKNQAFRVAKHKENLVDFCSNDYLSLARNSDLKTLIHSKSAALPLGSTGSRLLSGHFEFIDELEDLLGDFHQSEAALVFNSGYNANLALLSCIPRRSDIILYDELMHASIHDGMKMTAATCLPFPHNDTVFLEQLLAQYADKTTFVLVESIYSMDGDAAPLKVVANLCTQFGANLIVDEAHSTGVFGKKGEGLCVELGIQEQVFARLHTFGKAIGAHGAAVLGTRLLKDYLLNYAKPLIYTTALSPHAILTVLEVYRHLEQEGALYIAELAEKINYFRAFIQAKGIENYIDSNSPIQSIIIPGNQQVVALSTHLEQLGLDARPIRTPTVTAGKERIRICLHRHNSEAAIRELVEAISGPS